MFKSMHLSTITLLLLHLPLIHAQQTSSDRDGAFIAFSRLIDGDLVQGSNVTVRYLIHNVGKQDATDIALKDHSFPASRFTVFEGSFRPTFDSLSAGTGLQSDVVIMPKKAGELIVSPATVSYSDGQTRRVSQLASGENIVVEDVISYRRRTDRHQREWFIYTIAIVLLCMAPYLYSESVMKSIDTETSNKKRN